MNQYWSIFKLIKGNFKEIGEFMEQSMNGSNSANEKLSFRCQMDGEEVTISYSLQSLDQIEEDLRK